MENYQLVLIGAWLFAVHLGQVYDYNWETETVGAHIGPYDPNNAESVIYQPPAGSGLHQDQDQGLSMYDPNYIAWWTAQQGQEQ